MRRVVVSGIGAVNAAGAGIAGIWRRLRADPPAPVRYTGPPPADGVSFPVYRAAPCPLADLGLPARSRVWLDSEEVAGARDLQHLIASTALAFADAGLPADCRGQEPPVAVVAANESPGFEQLSRALFELGGEAPMPDDPLARYAQLAGRFFQLNTFLLPHQLARVFGMDGLSLFVNSACASGLNALAVAAEEIRAGRSRVAVVAAGDDPLSVAKFLWFDGQGLYARDGVIRPFDPDQRGTVFGDGGAALVLEDGEHARARGARPYAELLGAGFAQDGWKIAVPSPAQAAAARALERALAAAGVAAAEVDLVVPHGVGTPASDQYEAMVLHRVFGGGRWPAVTALKPLVGHNLGGSALMELAILLAAVREGAIPPTLGHARPHDRHPLPLVREWREQPIGLAVKLTCGFAGYYGAAVFRAVAAEER